MQQQQKQADALTQQQQQHEQQQAAAAAEAAAAAAAAAATAATAAAAATAAVAAAEFAAEEQARMMREQKEAFDERLRLQQTHTQGLENQMKNAQMQQTLTTDVNNPTMADRLLEAQVRFYNYHVKTPFSQQSFYFFLTCDFFTGC